MHLIVDGYNLLHVTGITSRRGDLQGSRAALLRFLASAIPPDQRPWTTVVFDAADAPPGLPRETSHEEMTVRYAADYDDADALIEELIALNHVPRALLVVSSDHRIQRAARRRRAQFVDSDVWFADALRRRRQGESPPPRSAKPQGPLSPREIAYWLTEFGNPSEVIEPPPPRPSRRPPRPNASPPASPADLQNPFPPGYGEDLLPEDDA